MKINDVNRNIKTKTGSDTGNAKNRATERVSGETAKPGALQVADVASNTFSPETKLGDINRNVTPAAEIPSSSNKGTTSSTSAPKQGRVKENQNTATQRAAERAKRQAQRKKFSGTFNKVKDYFNNKENIKPREKFAYTTAVIAGGLPLIGGTLALGNYFVQNLTDAIKDYKLKKALLNLKPVVLTPNNNNSISDSSAVTPAAPSNDSTYVVSSQSDNTSDNTSSPGVSPEVIITAPRIRRKSGSIIRPVVTHEKISTVPRRDVVNRSVAKPEAAINHGRRRKFSDNIALSHAPTITEEEIKQNVPEFKAPPISVADAEFALSGTPEENAEKQRLLNSLGVDVPVDGNLTPGQSRALRQLYNSGRVISQKNGGKIKYMYLFK